MKKLGLPLFIERAIEVHGNRYSYDRAIYVDAKTPILVGCSLHGYFKQTPDTHLRGSGCPTCGNILTGQKKRQCGAETFKSKAHQIHKNKYNYDHINYSDAHTKVEILCPKHGSFWQTPNSHLNGQGCSKCSRERQSISNTLSEKAFVEKARKVHGDAYLYSDLHYINTQNKVKITCPKHGDFWQTPNSHISGRCGCPKCGYERAGVAHNKGIKAFIKEAREVHSLLYSYEKVCYINTKTKVEIVCAKHGSFWQTPEKHIHQATGCPLCGGSKGEIKIKDILDKNSIKSIPQHSFSDLGKRLRFDFYLPDLNTCIEYDGLQHFQPVSWFGGEKGLYKQLERDKRKAEFCEANNIKLIRISYRDFDLIEDILLEVLK